MVADVHIFNTFVFSILALKRATFRKYIFILSSGKAHCFDEVSSDFYSWTNMASFTVQFGK